MPGGARLTGAGESRPAGAAPFPLAEGGRRSGTQSEGLSSPHTLTRSSREHLRSGKDRKTAGFMVSMGSTAGSGGGGWDWTGLEKGWAPGPAAAAPRPLDPELQRRTPGTTSREASHALTSGSCPSRSTSGNVVHIAFTDPVVGELGLSFPVSPVSRTAKTSVRGALRDWKGPRTSVPPGQELQFPEGGAAGSLRLLLQSSGALVSWGLFLWAQWPDLAGGAAP